jgi:hypothetical protein
LPANATVHRGTCVERQRGKIAKPCIWGGSWMFCVFVAAEHVIS